MSDVQFEYSCSIDVPPARVYDYLAEPEHYRGLQPFVIAVRDLEYGQNEDGHPIRRYTAVERFHFLGFVRYDNVIRVQMTLQKPGELLLNDVEARLNVRVHFVTTFQPREGGTDVTETVTIHVHRLLQHYVVSQAKIAQHARFTTLKALLEAAHTDDA